MDHLTVDDLLAELRARGCYALAVLDVEAVKTFIKENQDEYGTPSDEDINAACYKVWYHWECGEEQNLAMDFALEKLSPAQQAA